MLCQPVPKPLPLQPAQRSLPRHDVVYAIHDFHVRFLLYFACVYSGFLLGLFPAIKLWKN